VSDDRSDASAPSPLPGPGTTRRGGAHLEVHGLVKEFIHGGRRLRILDDVNL
jgi:hypothetical protein